MDSASGDRVADPQRQMLPKLRLKEASNLYYGEPERCARRKNGDANNGLARVGATIPSVNQG